MASKTVLRALLSKWGLLSINYQTADPATLRIASDLATGQIDDEQHVIDLQAEQVPDNVDPATGKCATLVLIRKKPMTPYWTRRLTCNGTWEAGAVPLPYPAREVMRWPGRRTGAGLFSPGCRVFAEREGKTNNESVRNTVYPGANQPAG